MGVRKYCRGSGLVQFMLCDPHGNEKLLLLQCGHYHNGIVARYGGLTTYQFQPRMVDGQTRGVMKARFQTG
jgi:hypothetical protein